MSVSLTFPLLLPAHIPKTIMSFFSSPHHLRIIVIITHQEMYHAYSLVRSFACKLQNASFFFGAERETKESKEEEWKRVRNVNDRPTQAKYFYVSSRERREKKEARRKALRKHISGFMFSLRWCTKKTQFVACTSESVERNVLQSFSIVWCQQTLRNLLLIE